MRTKTTLVAMKMVPAEVEALDDLVRLFFESRSAALRAALDLLFEKLKLKRSQEIFIEHERLIHAPRRRKSTRGPTPRGNKYPRSTREESTE